MWSKLFLVNCPFLLREMKCFRTAFDRLYRTFLESDREAMRRMMRKAAENRKKFDKTEKKEKQ